MPPPYRQLHRCAGLSLLSDHGQPSWRMATRTIYHLPNTYSGSTTDVSSSNESSHVKNVYDGDRGVRHDYDSGEEAAEEEEEEEEEEVVVCTAPQTLLYVPNTTPQIEGYGGVVHTPTRYLRPYDEEDYGAVLVKATAAAADTAVAPVLVEKESADAAASLLSHGCKSPANFETGVWRSHRDEKKTQSHTDVGERWASDDCTDAAAGEEEDSSPVCFNGTRNRPCQPVPQRSRQDDTSTPVCRAAASRASQQSCTAVEGKKKCVAAAILSNVPVSSAVEDACSSLQLPHQSSFGSTKCCEANVFTSPAWVEECSGVRGRHYDSNAAWVRSPIATSTSAAVHDLPGRDSCGSPLGGEVIAASEVSSAVFVGSSRPRTPRHLAIEHSKGVSGENERVPGCSLTAALFSSCRRSVPAVVRRNNGKYASRTNFYLEPRHSRHARRIALGDLPIATSTESSVSSSTSFRMFLWLFGTSRRTSAATCEAHCETNSLTTDDDMDAMSQVWSITAKYYAAHQP
ncbi:hypothetical protein JKF63_02795 [Porcisia hertigi]|uniref:Uncharacterized protein n=1 Tax=Porcisia hertigi TaxID=2761500 RepID=A0A836HSW0_9TRYP|nr:hypothetical protein JKF63_02795 [Porcisia hertigi]